MSHFPVLVISGNGRDVCRDVESLLAPFHEFECTGINDQYVQSVDELQEMHNEYAKWQGEERPGKHPDVSFLEYCIDHHGSKEQVIKSGQAPDLNGNQKYGWIRVDENGIVTEIVRRTNPQAKWDWWRIGGRWSGMLRLKSGQDTDQARKSDIDFAWMRDEAATRAGKTWDAIHGVVQNRVVESWESVRARMNNIDKAREFYHAQAVIIDLRAAEHENKVPFMMSYEEWLRPRDVCVTEAAEMAGVTHAVVTKDGQWHERGRMGWWAHVHDERSAADWESQFGTVIDSLADDDLLTIVDCHI